MPEQKAILPVESRRNQRLRAPCAVIAVCLFTSLIGTARAEDFAISLYGGRMTDETAADAISTSVSFVDAYLVVGAFSWTFWRPVEDWISLEVEGNVGKYFGDQESWEFNAALAARWHMFPWSDTVATNIAFGLGPSYASEVPAVEEETRDSSEQLLVFWFAEVALGPPKGSWAAIIRLHHRSPGFGTFAEDGGSNTWALGLRFRF